MNRSPLRRQGKGASYPGLEIIAKLATVLEVEPRLSGDGNQRA